MEIVSIYFVQDGGLANCRRVHDMDTTDGICAGERISPRDAIFFYASGIFPVMRDRRELEKSSVMPDAAAPWRTCRTGQGRMGEPSRSEERIEN